MPCPDNCTCVLEGERGIRTDGTGTLGDPYTPQPDSPGYTIPYTVAGPGLPAANATLDKGWLVWQRDVRRLVVFDETDWTVVSPEWRQTYPDNTTVDGAAGVYKALPGTIDLPPGAWFLKANGVLEGTVDPPASSGAPAFDWSQVVVQVQMVNTGIGLLDATRMTASSFRVTMDAGFEGVFAPLIEIPFDLQNCILVPPATLVVVGLEVMRDVDAPAMGLSIISADLAAVRLAEYDFTT